MQKTEIGGSKITIILFTTIVLLITSKVYAENYDFRKTNWGMSQKEVLASEAMKPAEQGKEMTVYECTISSKNVVLAYRFVQNKLYGATYLLRTKHSHSIQYIGDYQALKKELIKKYGKPLRDETRWASASHKEYNASSPGYAVSTGILSYLATWETGKTKISIMLTGDNFKTHCMISYDSKEIQHLREQKANHQNTTDF
jgi:hypothetical protein